MYYRLYDDGDYKVISGGYVDIFGKEKMTFYGRYKNDMLCDQQGLENAIMLLSKKGFLEIEFNVNNGLWIENNDNTYNLIFDIEGYIRKLKLITEGGDFSPGKHEIGGYLHYHIIN